MSGQASSTVRFELKQMYETVRRILIISIFELSRTMSLQIFYICVEHTDFLTITSKPKLSNFQELWFCKVFIKVHLQKLGHFWHPRQSQARNH